MKVRCCEIINQNRDSKCEWSKTKHVTKLFQIKRDLQDVIILG